MTIDVDIFVSPAKHGRHIGIMTPSQSTSTSSSSLLSSASHFCFPINNF